MKVSGPGKTSGASGVSKSKKAGKAADGNFGDMLASAADAAVEASGVETTQAIAQVDALLALQEAGDSTQKQKRAKLIRRGDDLLEALDNVRMAMLGGTLTIGHMIDIADVIASHRENVDDPRLTAIMDEIDLRAQVELAKMRVAMDVTG